MVSEIFKITPTRPLVLVESLTPLGPFEEKQNVRPSRFPCGFGNQAAQSWGRRKSAEWPVKWLMKKTSNSLKRKLVSGSK